MCAAICVKYKSTVKLGKFSRVNGQSTLIILIGHRSAFSSKIYKQHDAAIKIFGQNLGQICPWMKILVHGAMECHPLE